MTVHIKLHLASHLLRREARGAKWRLLTLIT